MADASAYLNGLDLHQAERELLRCCGSQRWVSELLHCRPFVSDAQLKQRAREIWARLAPADYLEAFAHHPEIGADLDQLREKFAASLTWSSAEQAGVNDAGEQTLRALRDGNLAYKRRFGFIFIVCATGKSASQMLAALQARLPNAPEQELLVAAAEQAKITELRLEKLGS